jgi:hypothetical protein
MLDGKIGHDDESVPPEFYPVKDRVLFDYPVDDPATNEEVTIKLDVTVDGEIDYDWTSRFVKTGMRKRRLWNEGRVTSYKPVKFKVNQVIMPDGESISFDEAKEIFGEKYFKDDDILSVIEVEIGDAQNKLFHNVKY